MIPPELSGCYPFFRQLIRKKMLFDITHIYSKAPALKPLCKEHRIFFI